MVEVAKISNRSKGAGQLMIALFLIALAAGAASALMFASIISGALFSLVLFYLAPLPLMVAAIGWGPMWAGIGAQVRLVGADAQVHYSQIRRQHFQAAWAGWVADYRDAKDFLFLAQTSSKDMNSGRYSNPKYDALIAQSDNTRDPMARADQLQQAEQIMLNDVAFAPVIYDVSRAIVSKQVRNWADNNVTVNRTRYIKLNRQLVDV